MEKQRKDNYLSRFNGLNLSEEQLERQWRARLEEEESLRIAEAINMSLASQQITFGYGSGGGGSESLPSECIEFVVNTTEGTYFEVSFRSNTEDFTYTVNWGDGVAEEGSSGEGYAGLNHTYPEGVADYTVRVCFSNPSVIHDIDFPGFD